MNNVLLHTTHDTFNLYSIVTKQTEVESLQQRAADLEAEGERRAGVISRLEEDLLTSQRVAGGGAAGAGATGEALRGGWEGGEWGAESSEQSMVRKEFK
jgi:hypothetical protein